MFKNAFPANNSLFGKVLTEVLTSYGLNVSDLMSVCMVQNQRVSNIKKG